MNILSILREAHFNAAMRDNASTQILKAAWESNGKQYIPAVTAAMQMFGGKHAPIKATYEFLYKCFQCSSSSNLEVVALNKLKAGERIPGWGSSFHKDGDDPVLQDFRNHFSRLNDDWWLEVVRVVGDSIYMHNGNRLFVNLAFFTAATCIIAGININLCESIMLEARLSAWNKILTDLEHDQG